MKVRSGGEQEEEGEREEGRGIGGKCGSEDR
jgi:hypothetical protein